jgi:tetratricopeptide (TPR) repeat protein
MIVAVIAVSRSRADDLDLNLGTIHFDVTGKPDAQHHVIEGVKLIHHMMYTEADRAFASAAAEDPQCALAYWGRAMSLIHPLWPDTPSAADLKLGAEQIRLGLACTGATPRERAYLEALNTYFDRDNAIDHAAGLRALDPAWIALADRYPEDLDALAFSALFHLAPVRFTTKDKSYRIQLEAASRAEKVLARIPDHPGAQHYKIHAYDSPLLADRALEVCDTYGGSAPDVPHALHMPTHIFTRRGMWDKAIHYNVRAAEAARKLDAVSGKLNGHYPHSLDYLAYAYLQRGQLQHAEAVRHQILALNGPYAATQHPQMGFAFAAIPARYALERQAWSEAAELPLHQPAAFPWDRSLLNCDSITHFARGIGAARSGKLEAARAEISELERIQADLSGGKKVPYWISQAETQALAVRAWVQFDAKNPDEAIALMRRAVALESATDKEAVTPGEVLPAGDLLGDMLLEAGKDIEALAAFEAVLVASPNRLNTLYGAGLVAERSGDNAKATEYYKQLTSVAAERDTPNSRVDHAREFLISAKATASTPIPTAHAIAKR